MLPALCLIPLIAALRVLIGWNIAAAPTLLLGSSPLAAVALCAGVYLPRRWSVLIPVSILLVSDWVLDRHFGVAFLSAGLLGRYLLLMGIVLAGSVLRSGSASVKLGTLLLWTLLGSTGFYLASNALSWLGSPFYAQTLGGLVQSWTFGLPGYPPSYVFWRNALVCDLFYTVVFFACVQRAGVARHIAAAEPASAVG